MGSRRDGLAPGWARAGGDPEGSGGAAVLGEDYPGTDTPVFTRDSDTSFIENAYSALAFPNGDLVVGGDVEFATNVRAAQLSRYGGSGFRTWSTTPSSVATVLLDVALVGNRVVALGVNGAVNPTTTEIEVYDPYGNKLDATSLGAPEVYYSAVAIEPTSEDAAAVLIDTLPFVASGLDATIVRVGFSGGLPQPGASHCRSTSTAKACRRPSPPRAPRSSSAAQRTSRSRRRPNRASCA